MQELPLREIRSPVLRRGRLLRALRFTYCIRSRTTLARAQDPKPAMLVDAHVHVWDAKFCAHPDHPLPNIKGTAADLVARMDAAGVHQTLVVQPINYKFDHACVADAMASYPARLHGVALADTTLAPEDAAKFLVQRVTGDGFKGVRINPNLAPGGLRTDAVGAVMRTAGELGVPVALFAQPAHLDDVRDLLRRFPQTKTVLDHFAFCSPTEHDAGQRKVLDMGAEFSQLYVKTSAWFRVSNEPWPHRDLFPFLLTLAATFGADRMLIGYVVQIHCRVDNFSSFIHDKSLNLIESNSILASVNSSDYPFVMEQCGYPKAFSALRESPLSDEDQALILGDSAAKLYQL